MDKNYNQIYLGTPFHPRKTYVRAGPSAISFFLRTKTNAKKDAASVPCAKQQQYFSIHINQW